VKRAERDELLLQALAACSHGTEWVEAGSVAGEANRRAGLYGVGRILSRMADETPSRCRKRWEGYMHRFRSRAT
jgi:hypothetical protein